MTIFLWFSIFFLNTRLWQYICCDQYMCMPCDNFGMPETSVSHNFKLSSHLNNFLETKAVNSNECCRILVFYISDSTEFLSLASHTPGITSYVPVCEQRSCLVNVLYETTSFSPSCEFHQTLLDSFVQPNHKNYYSPHKSCHHPSKQRMLKTKETENQKQSDKRMTVMIIHVFKLESQSNNTPNRPVITATI